MTIDEVTKNEGFWDLYEEELAVSVNRKPGEYFLEGLKPGEFASRVRAKMQRSPFSGINHNSTTFRRVAKRLGIRFNRQSLEFASLGKGLSPSQFEMLEAFSEFKKARDHEFECSKRCSEERSTPEHRDALTAASERRRETHARYLLLEARVREITRNKG